MKDIESNGEIIINSKSENSINEEKQIDKISYENFVEIVFSKKRQLTELVNIKTEIVNTKTELANIKKKLNAKIDKLLVNQKLMYHQISMIQSRDISKSVYHFFAQHLGIKYENKKNEEKPFYYLIRVINFLSNNDNKI